MFMLSGCFSKNEKGDWYRMVTNLNAELSEKLIGWRRDFHQFPETGFLEMRTASIVASILDELGFDLSMGKSVMSPEHCMGKPDDEARKSIINGR